MGLGKNAQYWYVWSFIADEPQCNVFSKGDKTFWIEGNEKTKWSKVFDSLEIQNK